MEKRFIRYNMFEYEPMISYLPSATGSLELVALGNNIRLLVLVRAWLWEGDKSSAQSA